MDISDKLHLLFQRVSDCLTSSQSVHPSLKKQNVYSICFICNTVYLWQYLSQFTHTIESRWKLHFKWKCQHIRSESDAANKMVVLSVRSDTWNVEMRPGVGQDERWLTSANWGSGPHAMTTSFEGRMWRGILAGSGFNTEEVQGVGW